MATTEVLGVLSLGKQKSCAFPVINHLTHSCLKSSSLTGRGVEQYSARWLEVNALSCSEGQCFGHAHAFSWDEREIPGGSASGEVKCIWKMPEIKFLKH